LFSTRKFSAEKLPLKLLEEQTHQGGKTISFKAAGGESAATFSKTND